MTAESALSLVVGSCSAKAVTDSMQWVTSRGHDWAAAAVVVCYTEFIQSTIIVHGASHYFQGHGVSIPKVSLPPEIAARRICWPHSLATSGGTMGGTAVPICLYLFSKNSVC
jgi:hypothetical protein